MSFFQYQAEYRANLWLGYELMLFLDKRGTFLILLSVMQNMGISYNLQNDRENGVVSWRKYFDKSWI